MIGINKKASDVLYSLSEWIGLFVVMQFCVLRYWGSTTFGFVFQYHYTQFATYSVIVAGLIRLVAGTCIDIIHAGNKKQLFFVMFRFAAALSFLVPFSCTAERFGYVELIYLPFMAYCLYGAKPERVMRVYAVCLSIPLAATILSALSGAIENYLYLGGGTRGILRGSYGIKYPTDFAAYIIYLFLSAWGSGRFKNWRYTAFSTALALFMAYMIYTYPHGTNSTLCSILIAVVIVYDGLSEKVFPRYKVTRKITKVVDWLTIGAFPICAAGIFILSWLYGKGNGLAVRINQIISNRLYFIWYSYEKYGLHWFGTLTPQQGGGLLYNDQYEFIDSSYGVILLRYGTIAFFMIAAVWVWMTWKAVSTGHRRIALVMAVIAFHSIAEQRFTEINILLSMPLCGFAVYSNKMDLSESHGKTRSKVKAVTAWGVGAVTVALFVLLAPRLLSWARGLVAVNGWSGSGERTKYILFFWLICFVLFALFGLFLYMLIAAAVEKKKVSVMGAAGAAVVVLSSVAGLIWVDSTVSEKAYLYEPQISADKEAVELILANAEEPVYVGQAEDIYKRSFNGISDRVLSDMEIARSGRGSILLDHDDDAFQLISTGARYAEISPYSGLFTYDDTLIERLRNDGYHVHGYYSAERNVNLAGLAGLNGLPVTDDGGLHLQGDAHTLRYGSCFSQLSGTYSVTFSLTVTGGDMTDPDTELCTLRVSSNWGRFIWLERDIYVKDLDENGHIDVSLVYYTIDTEGVEYLVFCRDGIEMNVNNISWKNTPSVDEWREYTSEGLLKKVLYYTADGLPFEQPEGHYGGEYEYSNGNELWTRYRYLDSDGKTPKVITFGYAQVERQYNNLKQVIEEKYLDINGDLCLCMSGYARYRQTYDSRGNVLTTVYYDTEGKLILNSSGFAVAEWQYDDDNNRIIERYFDENNEPVILSSGYAEIHRVYDNEHHVIRETYYGVDGEPLALGNNQASVE